MMTLVSPAAGARPHSATPASPSPSSMAATSDLWLKIDQLHLNYLKAEENTKKIDVRKKLEGYIHQYLCVVPQERKFCNPLMSEVLSDSVRWVPDFSGLKAARAFEALETYTANLLNQPWRKEFREIKQYCGFYKHNIENTLSGAERVFYQMGYRSTGRDSVMLDGQVDLDRVTTVARDCILAYVECQILATIVEGVSAHFPCTWEEALVFRRDHIGTPEQAVRSLLYAKNQCQYQASITPALGIHSHQPGGSALSSFSAAAPTYTMPMAYLPLAMGEKVNGSAAGGRTIPTARLVEVDDDAVDASRNQRINVVSPRPPSRPTSRAGASPMIPLTVKSLEAEHKRKSQMILPPSERYRDEDDSSDQRSSGRATASGDRDDSTGTWDYVYRELENVGYTKDQSERPDVLSLLDKVNRARQASGNANALSPLSAGEAELLRQIQKSRSMERRVAATPPATPPNRHDQESPTADEVDAVHRRFRRNSGAGTNTYSFKNASGSDAMKDNKKSLRHSRPLDPPRPMPPVLQERVLQQSAPETSTSFASDGWNCYACTFRNGAAVEICEMCGKSRNSPDLYASIVASSSASEAACSPLPSSDSPDGSAAADAVACAKCTLINPRRLKICEACGATLPTS